MDANHTQRVANQDRERLNQLSHQVIGAALRVRSELGFGFAEKVYENALLVEMRKEGRAVEQQRGVHVYYRGEIIGDYVPDLLVEQSLIVEILRPEPARGWSRRARVLNGAIERVVVPSALKSLRPFASGLRPFAFSRRFSLAMTTTE